jgi:hypothetical protein
MTTAQLTPTTDLSPAVVKVGLQLSGPEWVSCFPGSRDTSTLVPEFRVAVDSFIDAMRAAGVQVRPQSTFRPIERSYLMHWCWEIKHGVDPVVVPKVDGVVIEWVHPTLHESVRAAERMVTAYGMNNLHTAPALHSLHNDGQAIDMDISWSGSVEIEDAEGTVVHVTTTPRTGMNAQLKHIGASYGVIKFVGGATDKPHWSSTGR